MTPTLTQLTDVAGPRAPYVTPEDDRSAKALRLLAELGAIAPTTVLTPLLDVGEACGLERGAR